MKKEFVPYDLALALKELGFKEDCLSFIKEDGQLLIANPEEYGELPAPLFQQAFRWFRDKYNISSFVKNEYSNTKAIGYYFGIDGVKKDYYSKPYTTYEEAELACLQKMIELVKNKIHDRQH